MTEKREQWTLQKREAGNEKRTELEEKLKEKHVQEVLQMKVHCLGGAVQRSCRLQASILVLQFHGCQFY